MDEMLELANRFYAQFPHVRTLEAFARQGNYIGLAIMCKRRILSFAASTKFDADNVYRSGTTPKILLEKTKIYEMFTLLATSYVIPLRVFEKNRVWDALAKTTTVLTDPKLNSQMKKYTNENAFAFLSSVLQIMDDVSNPTNEEETDEIETEECAIARSIRDTTAEASTNANANLAPDARLADDDANRATEPEIEEPDASDDDVSRKLGYNRFMISNPWQHGMRLLEKDNIKVKRAAKFALARRKMMLNRAIIDHVGNSRSDNSLVLKEEKELVTPPWRRAAIKRFGRFY